MPLEGLTLGQHGARNAEDARAARHPTRPSQVEAAACARRWWRRRRGPRRRSGSRAASCRRCRRTARRPRRARSPSGIASSSQRILLAENSGSIVRPVRCFERCAAGRGRGAPRRTARCAGTARRCTGRAGRPVARSQTSTDSRWLRDRRPRRSRRSPAATRHSSMASSTLRQSAVASCSTQPGCGNAIVDRPRRARDDVAALVEQQHLGVRRALVDGEDVCRARHARSAPRTSDARRVADAFRRRGRSARAGTPPTRSARTRPGRRGCASAPGATSTTTSATALPRPP